MNHIIIPVIQIALSMWEIWICYQFLYFMVLDENDISKKEKIAKWCNIIIVGGTVGINRLNAFFSSPMLFFQIIVTIFFLRKNKNKTLIAGSVIVLTVMVAVIDMILALFSYEFLGKDFYSVIYVYAITWQKEVVFLISRSILCLSVFVLKNKIRNIHEVAQQCKYVVFVMGIILGILILRYQWMLDGMVNGNIFRKGASTSITLLYATILVIFIGILMGKYYYMKQEKEAILLREQLLKECYIEVMKNHQMMHDMKNHFLLLQRYEKEKNWEKLHNYLEEINKGIVIELTKIWTGNIVVDTVLNSKKLQAEKLGIKVKIESEIVAIFPFTNQESISLFGNLIDNSIEACNRMKSSNKWIFINIQKKNQLLCIKIDNAMEGVINEKNGRLISEKKDKGVHGYGLKNIRQVVNKYEGIYLYEVSKDRFSTTISFFANEYIS